MVAAFTPLPAGFVLDGKWRIDCLLGTGGMGAVYRATHLRNNVTLAAKVLHPGIANDPVARERFLLEGYAANSVGGGGTVQVLDDGKSPDGYVYLIMELLQGETVDGLAERRGGKLPIDETLRIAEQLLTTVAAAHAQGILHRDLKPENLFLTRSGQLKVLDFGLASIKQHTNQARLTVTGEPMGTPAFMPPEQALANWDQVDARSDVYSIAASVWTLLTDTLVHEGTTVPQLLVNVSTKQAAPIRSASPELPQPIADVFDRALRFDRRGRWGDAGEMLRALRDAMSRCGMQGSLPFEPTVVANAASVLAAAQTAAGAVDIGRAEVPSSEDRAARARGADPTRTVAPVSSGGRPDRTRRPKGMVAVIAFAVVAVGGVAGAALYVAKSRAPAETPTAIRASGTGSTTISVVRVTPAAESDTVAASTAPVSAAPPQQPAPSALASASTRPPSTSAPVASPVPRPFLPTKPLQPDDPLNVYRPH